MRAHARWMVVYKRGRCIRNVVAVVRLELWLSSRTGESTSRNGAFILSCACHLLRSGSLEVGEGDGEGGDSGGFCAEDCGA
jgi:hypothetical protein